MPPPIIIIKKKSAHGGHHGGAWKVAYADFVTAMMALFIVLWLLSNSSKQTQVAISGYFKDPSSTANKTGTTLSGTGESIPITKEDMTKLKDKLQKTIQKINDLDKLKNIEMKVTPEGLRIELIESEKGTFFESGRAALNNSGQELLGLLAVELGHVPNNISVEGHTDAKPYSGKSSYSNWELSSDRANAARRLMQREGGLRHDQVSQVRGFADERLRNLKNPLDPSNRRISIIVQYLSSNADEAGSAVEDGKGPENEKPSVPAGKAESDAPAKKH